MRDEFTVSWVVLAMRLVLAVVLVSTGYTMIFLAGPLEEGQSPSFVSDFESWPPDSQLWAMDWAGEEGNAIVLAAARGLGFLVPWALLIGGLMILAGLFTRWAGVGLCVTFIVILAGLLIKIPFTDLSTHIFPYFAFAALILLLESRGNQFSVDALIFKGRRVSPERGACLAVLFARLTIGLVFLLGAYTKLRIIGLEEFVNGTFVEGYAETWLPGFLLAPAGYFDVFAQLIGGALLLLGLFTSAAAILCTVFLLMIIFGLTVASPFQNFATHVIPFLAIVLFIFYFARQGRNHYSLDNLLFGRKKG